MDDSQIRSALATATELQRHSDLYKSWIAGSIARRSSPELGNAGLAQREGHRTPEALVQLITGGSRAEAVKLVKVGTLLTTVDTADSLAESDPEAARLFQSKLAWQSPLAHAVNAGDISIDAADAIRRGLGSPDDAVTANHLEAAIRTLIVEASGTLTAGLRPTPDQLFGAARNLRDELDVHAIELREKTQNDIQYVRAHRRPDGMVAGTFLLAPENGDLVLETLDQGTNPRRGGPRFTSEPGKTWAKAVVDDPRSNDRINVETLMGALQAAAAADKSRLPGRRPAVRVITVEDPATGGFSDGRLEGSHSAVSVATVERNACDGGTVRVVIDQQGQVMEIGKEQRLFSPQQRTALAVRDGGCMVPGCHRPPAWCEAHHVLWFRRDRGKTEIKNGILLCRHHHMLVHNNGWDIVLRDGSYWLIPPVSVDPQRVPRPMRSNNDLIEKIRRAHSADSAAATDQTPRSEPESRSSPGTG